MTTTSSPQPSVVISIHKIITLLSCAAVILIIFHIISVFLYRWWPDDFWLLEARSGFIRLFNFNRAANIPKWYTSFQLLLGSGLFGLIAISRQSRDEKYIRYWGGLALLSLLVSLAEQALLHRMLATLLRLLTNTSQPAGYLWMLPAILIIFAMCVVYYRFFMFLPKRTRILLLVAGAIYISGGMGIDLANALLHSTGFTAQILTLVEGGLEFGGLILLIYALLDYIRDNLVSLELAVKLI